VAVSVADAARLVEAESVAGSAAESARLVEAAPGCPPMLSALIEAGCRVLLPVVGGGAPGPLDWAELDAGAVALGRFGLVEPTGPRLGPTAITEASTILVPALAVDRRGVRLGRGGGYYDRSLRLASGRARLVAVVRDDELVPHLPAEPHDVPMTAALTPSAGLHDL
jgi:5-formyltetrahydrofolate cyclo-ligase